MPRAALLLLLVTTACTSSIHHGLEERDANELVSALVERGFTAKKVPEKGKKATWAIEVDSERATEALRVLTELKLPRAPRSTTRELAMQAALVETPQAERLKQLEAQEGDLEVGLETVDGVVSAAVELVVPPPPRPGQQPGLSKASVLLRAEPEATERLGQQREQLKALVAAAVDGLSAAEVVLVIDTVQPPPPAPVKVAAARPPTVAVLGGVMSVLAVGLIGLTRWVQQLKRHARGLEESLAQAQLAAAAKGPMSPVAHKKAA